MSIIHIEPYYYAHIKDKSENIIYLLEGPRTYVIKSHEELVLSSTAMIHLPRNHFITIGNPVLRDEKNEVVYEVLNNSQSKLAKLRFGDEEVRSDDIFKEPFPLYPGEEIIKNISSAIILNEQQALRVEALRDFVDDLGEERETGQEWVIPGPMVFKDRVELRILEIIDASIIIRASALRVRAKKDFVDRKGIKRISGEEWLVRDIGPYIPAAAEEVVKLEKAYNLSDTFAITLEATSNFVDIYGTQRNVGEQWLLTIDTTSQHIPDVYEKVISTNTKLILNRWQYCKVQNPYKNGVNHYGITEVRKGECSFFLQPWEILVDNRISDNYILADGEALLVLCKENFKDEYGEHKPGERWLVRGPRSYVPEIEVEILDLRKRIPLNDFEGIYVRDIHTGEIKMITGTSYLLEAHEELWEKELPRDVELLLQSEGTIHKNTKINAKPRDKTRVVTFTVPHNTVTQIFDYREKLNKMVFGPSMIKIGPYEQFTVLELSGDNPKTEGVIKSLLLRLGPDFISDTIEVETSDHAKLLLKLTYSWKFEFDIGNQDHLDKLFQVPDFVGDCCKSIASRIRGIVSSVTFDSFHKDSSSIVQIGVFGKDKDTGKLKKPLIFKSNNLVISNVDIQSQEPVDAKTREILNESMKLSMETNIKIQEAEARHRENRANQEAKGKVERKKIEDDTDAEEKRLILLQLQADNESIKISGTEESQAKAKASEMEINSEADLEKAKNQFEADKIKKRAELDRTQKFYKEEISNLSRISKLEVERARSLANSTVDKLTTMVSAIGKQTLVEMARAGPESQAAILKSIGVKSLLITDGKNPVNLFNTSGGLLGATTLPAINNNNQETLKDNDSESAHDYNDRYGDII